MTGDDTHSFQLRRKNKSTPMNNRKLYSVAGNSQQLDGGAMFGNCPKELWQRWLPPDEIGRIPLACRALLVRDEQGRDILFESGIGCFQEPRLRRRYGVVEDEPVLIENLHGIGLSPEDIDVIVLSHLHFDHAGGLLRPYREGAAPELAFPNARYVVGREAFARSRQPHVRDRASFIPELAGLLEDTGRLELVEGEHSETLGEGYRLLPSEGHTPGMLVTRIDTPWGPVLFGADLVPGIPWVHVPITMGYDRFPERLIDEKLAYLGGLADERGHLFFTHDPNTACARIRRTAKGSFEAFDLKNSLQGGLD